MQKKMGHKSLLPGKELERTKNNIESTLWFNAAVTGVPADKISHQTVTDALSSLHLPRSSESLQSLSTTQSANRTLVQPVLKIAFESTTMSHCLIASSLSSRTIVFSLHSSFSNPNQTTVLQPSALFMHCRMWTAAFRSPIWTSSFTGLIHNRFNSA